MPVAPFWAAFWAALRAAVRLPLFLLANVVLIPVYALCLGPARGLRRPIQVLWCRIMLALAGVQVRAFGTPHGGGPTLWVANHVSYLDIAVLSRRLPGVFVAKSEVANWPLFGIIARLTGTIFVSRQPARARVQRETIRHHLAAGGNLLLFPEGTSTDGSAVAPFKSSLLDIASAGGTGPAVTVQPISLAYTRDRAGVPLTGPRRGIYCWYGDMTLAPHLIRMLGHPGATVEVWFHPPVDAETFSSRKALARHCEAEVAAGIAAAHDDLIARGKQAAE